MIVVKISNWYTRRPKYADPFQAPEQVGIAIAGEVLGHPRKPDGSRVTTSRIVRVNGRHIWTESGTEYVLVGEPMPRFLDHLKTIGCTYDAVEPIKVGPRRG